jgi:dienelactone hydrolase
MRPFALRATLNLGAFVAAYVLTGEVLPLRAQTLEVIPNHVLSDETVTIRGSGLQPNQRVTIQAKLVDGAEHRWSSEAEFLANAQGAIDVSHQAPLKGSYNEVSAMGLIWSMKPEEKHVERYISPRDLGTQIIEFRLIEDGKQVSSVQLVQETIAEGVHQIKVQGQLHGVLFIPAASGRHPGVLVVGGSEGGAPTQKAAWLASHGFAALALAYFGYDDLPPDLSAIPLEYFGHALAWMRQRPEILPDRIAVVGTSRGGELALQLGSMYPHIFAVVAYVPASVRYAACCGSPRYPYAWTWQGQPLAYYVPRARTPPNPTAAMEAGIAVEHTQGPVLLISGEDDEVWSSSMMANAIVNRLKSAHFPYPVKHLNYSHAGHLAGRPEIVPAWHGKVSSPFPGRETNFGGTAKGDSQSSLDAIPSVLEFLRSSLESGVPAQ